MIVCLRVVDHLDERIREVGKRSLLTSNMEDIMYAQLSLERSTP